MNFKENHGTNIQSEYRIIILILTYSSPDHVLAVPAGVRRGSEEGGVHPGEGEGEDDRQAAAADRREGGEPEDGGKGSRKAIH